jgi:hypothetical protein
VGLRTGEGGGPLDGLDSLIMAWQGRALLERHGATSIETMLRSGPNAGSSSMTERIARSAASRVAKRSMAKSESEETKA